MKIVPGVVVIGSGGLIGSALACALIECGVVPVCVDQTSNAPPDVARAAAAAGVTPRYLACDVCDEAAVAGLVAALRAAGGAMNAVVNVAYPRAPGFGRGPLEQDGAAFARNLAVHVSAYFNVFKHFGGEFAAAKGGRIISFASIYGFFLARPELYAGTVMTISAEYVAAKAAVIQLNAYYAKIFRAAGVLCNCVSPGGVADGQDARFVERYGSHTTNGGLLPARAVVDTVLYLLSDLATTVTGRNHVVDAGFTL